MKHVKLFETFINEAGKKIKVGDHVKIKGDSYVYTVKKLKDSEAEVEDGHGKIYTTNVHKLTLL